MRRLLLLTAFASGPQALAVDPGAVTQDRARIAELAGTLEVHARDLLRSLDKGGRPARLLSDADHLLEASRSFADLARSPSSDRDYLVMSLRVLQEEWAPLSSELPDDVRARLLAPIDDLLKELAPLVARAAADTQEATGSSRTDDPGAPRLSLASDGWHGPVLERYLRIKGKATGIDLQQIDVVVTDARNRVVYSGEDVQPEIAAHYRTRPFTHGQRTSVTFSLRFTGDMLAKGENFITFTVVDESGRSEDQTIAAGK